MKLLKVKTSHGVLLVEKVSDNTAIIKSIPQSPMYGYDDLILVSRDKDPMVIKKENYTWELTYPLLLGQKKENRDHIKIQEYLESKGYKSTCPIKGLLYFAVPSGVRPDSVYDDFEDKPVKFTCKPVI